MMQSKDTVHPGLEPVLIRKAVLKDKDQLYELFKEVNKEFIPPISKKKGREMEKEIEDFTIKIIKNMWGVPIILESNGEIRGIVCVSFDYWIKKGVEKFRGVPHITELATHPKYRHRGEATLLLEFTFIWLRDVGYKKVTIRTWSTNTEALRLYEHLGFKRFKTIKNDRGKGIDTVYLIKSLES